MGFISDLVDRFDVQLVFCTLSPCGPDFGGGRALLLSPLFDSAPNHGGLGGITDWNVRFPLPNTLAAHLPLQLLRSFLPGSVCPGCHVGLSPGS